MKKVKYERPEPFDIKESDLFRLANKLYDNPHKWQWICPACGYIQTGEDFKKINVEAGGHVYFSCIGRWLEGKHDWFKGTSPCNYTNGGLFNIAIMKVVKDDGNEGMVFEVKGVRKLLVQEIKDA